MKNLGATNDESTALAAAVVQLQLDRWRATHTRTYHNELLHLQLDVGDTVLHVTFVNQSGWSRYSRTFLAADVTLARNGQQVGEARYYDSTSNPILAHVVGKLESEAARIETQLNAFTQAASRGPLPSLADLRPLTGSEAKERHGSPGTPFFSHPRSYYCGYSAIVGDVSVCATRIYRPVGERLYVGEERHYGPILRPRWEYTLTLSGNSLCPLTDYWRTVRYDTDHARCSKNWQDAKRAFVKMQSVHNREIGWKPTVRDAIVTVERFVRPTAWANGVVRRAVTNFDPFSFEKVVDAHEVLVGKGRARGVLNIPGGESVASFALLHGDDRMQIDACRILRNASGVEAVAAIGNVIGSSFSPDVVRAAIAAVEELTVQSRPQLVEPLRRLRDEVQSILDAAKDTRNTFPDQLRAALYHRSGVASPTDDSALPHFRLGNPGGIFLAKIAYRNIDEFRRRPPSFAENPWFA